jgi:hypothetical protein
LSEKNSVKCGECAILEINFKLEFLRNLLRERR